MSYWDDPERKADALAKRAATRAELGPRLGQAPFGGHRVVYDGWHVRLDGEVLPF